MGLSEGFGPYRVLAPPVVSFTEGCCPLLERRRNTPNLARLSIWRVLSIYSPFIPFTLCLMDKA